MPTVLRNVRKDPYSDQTRQEWVKLPFKEVSSGERARYLAGKAALLGVLGLVVWGIGTPGTTPSPEETMRDARSKILPKFEQMSDRQRFEAQYLSPVYVEPANRDSVGGRGIWSALNDSNDFSLRIGQKCLAGSAFDTRSQNVYRDNRVSSVAAVTYEDGLVTVHPAGNGSSSLQFTSNAGILKPTENTLDSLRVNNCSTEPGVPVASAPSTAYNAASDLESNFTVQQPFLP